MFERARQRAEAALADGRTRLEAGDPAAALGPLERARRDYLGARDLAGMQELRLAVEQGYRDCDPTDEPLYEQLLYASGQNARFLSRSRAAAAGVQWEDPHPELDDPSRPEIRVERSIRRRDVPWIIVFGTIGTVVVAGAIAAYVYVLVTATRTRTIVNDRSAAVIVGTCDSPCDSADDVRILEPGEKWRIRTSDDYFVVRESNGARLGCVRVTTNVRTSSAGACPLGG